MKEEAEGVPIFPVAAVTIGPVPAMGIVIFQPDFLSHPMQHLREATPGRRYALTPVQVRDLIEKMQSALRYLETHADEEGRIGPRQ